MAGYSGTPLAKKLGLKEGQTVAFLQAPENLTALLEPLPTDLRIHNRLAADLSVLLFFTTRRAELEKKFDRLQASLLPNGGLWICWPKKASGVETDVNENIVRDIALANGLVDNKVCAIDETWSGLRLVFRLKDRPKNKS
ncbi:MAG: hypothetical protein U0793_14055 [Gemmataceae bacterium]